LRIQAEVGPSIMESTLATPLEAACEMEIKGEWLKRQYIDFIDGGGGEI